MSDALFADAENAAPAPSESAGPRRTKLFPWDSVAAQLLEPYGESALDSMSLKQVYDAASRGNKTAAYHSHLCADQASDAWHVGAGVSMTAAALLAAFRHIETADIGKLIMPELLAKVKIEIDDLTPHLRILDMGKGSQSQKDTGSFRAAKRMRTTGSGTNVEPVTEADLRASAKAMHAWLRRDKTPLRSLLFLLGGGNTYYTAHTAEVVARACIRHKPITEEQFVEAVVTRSKSKEVVPETKSAGSDATGLFD